MYYLYETHCHCCLCSACAHFTPQDLVRAYHRAGFAGLVLTDHFIFGNTCVSRALPWEQRMQQYYSAYLAAREAGDALDFDVIFGLEHAYGRGKEVLIYGIDLPFLLANPDIPQLSLDTLVQRIHDYGGLVVQAHPYRNRAYIDSTVGPRLDLIDGIEVHNACNAPGDDPLALGLARQGDFLLTAGGDTHDPEDPGLGTAGLAFPHRIRSGKELTAALRSRNYRYLVQGKLLPELQASDLP